MTTVSKSGKALGNTVQIRCSWCEFRCMWPYPFPFFFLYFRLLRRCKKTGPYTGGQDSAGGMTGCSVRVVPLYTSFPMVLPCLTLPCLALLCLALPYLTLPCSALTDRSIYSWILCSLYHPLSLAIAIQVVIYVTATQKPFSFRKDDDHLLDTLIHH